MSQLWKRTRRRSCITASACRRLTASSPCRCQVRPVRSDTLRHTSVSQSSLSPTHPTTTHPPFHHSLHRILMPPAHTVAALPAVWGALRMSSTVSLTMVQQEAPNQPHRLAFWQRATTCRNRCTTGTQGFWVSAPCPKNHEPHKLPLKPLLGAWSRGQRQLVANPPRAGCCAAVRISLKGMLLISPFLFSPPRLAAQAMWQGFEIKSLGISFRGAAPNAAPSSGTQTQACTIQGSGSQYTQT